MYSTKHTFAFCIVRFSPLPLPLLYERGVEQNQLSGQVRTFVRSSYLSRVDVRSRLGRLRTCLHICFIDSRSDARNTSCSIVLPFSAALWCSASPKSAPFFSLLVSQLRLSWEDRPMTETHATFPASVVFPVWLILIGLPSAD